jgi:hypothetical protein
MEWIDHADGGVIRTEMFENAGGECSPVTLEHTADIALGLRVTDTQ